MSKFKIVTLGVGLGLAGLLTGRAEAATFTVTITNTSTVNWTEGLLTTQPLIAIGNSPQLGTNEYNTYTFVHSTCAKQETVICNPATCNDTGNAAVLAARWGLTIGVNAWIVPALPSTNPDSVWGPYNFTFSAPTTLSFVAAVAGSTDDMIAMHVVGDQNQLAVPLFDTNGFPLPANFNISGYDVSATSSGGVCASDCPSPGSGCFVQVGNATSGGTLTAQPSTAFSTAWTWSASGYATDGLALGDITTGAAGNELVCVMEGGDYWLDPPYTGAGRVAVISQTGATQSTFDSSAGTDFMGFPLVENLDGGAQLEYAAGEFGATGTMWARRTSSLALWGSSPYGWSGFWNMGPSAGDVSTLRSGNEVVVIDWDGNVKVLRRDTGAVLASYNTFTSNGEHLYGHAALANIDTASATLEIVLFGATQGKVMVLRPNTDGTMTMIYESTPIPGGVAAGSGPAVADVDGDGALDIVVAASGSADVYVFSTGHGTGCKYRWLAPGGSDYVWTSPVIGQVIPGGNKEIVVLARNSVLSVLNTGAAPAAGTCADGPAPTFVYTIGNGGQAWFTPALADLSGSAGLDVVAANYNTLEVVNVAENRVPFRVSNAGTSFFPSALVQQSGTTKTIFVSGWKNGSVYRFDLPAGGTTAVNWGTFMGDNTRTGAR